MPDRYEYQPTAQTLVRARPTTLRPAKSERRVVVQQDAPEPQRTNGELVRAWTDAIASVDALRFKPKTQAVQEARAVAEEQLHEAGDALAARIRQSYADAVQ